MSAKLKAAQAVSFRHCQLHCNRLRARNTVDIEGKRLSPIFPYIGYTTAAMFSYIKRPQSWQVLE